MFFARPWESSSVICHPSQLFALSPRMVRGSKSGLLKCFVRREEGGRSPGGPRRFSLWLGRDPTCAAGGGTPPRCRFLLCASQATRSETLLFTSGRPGAPPCARLSTNVFATSYSLSMLGTGGRSPVPAADLQYRARVKGFMQPRRLQVTLPLPSANSDPATPQRLSPRGARLHHGKGAGPGGADALCSDDSATSFCSAASSVGETAGKDGARVETQQPSGSGRLSRFLFRLAAMPSASQHHGPEALPPEEQEPLQLQNKAPSWNAGIRCWCLNFRGRVRLASVKNFQLVNSREPDGPISMQFGKVDQDVYILDFNPTVLSAVQAFAVALSTFDSKIML